MKQSGVEAQQVSLGLEFKERFYEGHPDRISNQENIATPFLQVHNLRNSIASVRSLSEILHDNLDIDKNKRQEFLTIIMEETEKLMQMVDPGKRDNYPPVTAN